MNLSAATPCRTAGTHLRVTGDTVSPRRGSRRRIDSSNTPVNCYKSNRRKRHRQRAPCTRSHH